MSFGLTEQGFVLKRLQDILNEQRQKAVELFQDLVQPGDSIDTSDSSALGRIIDLDAAGDSDRWEVAQMVYSAFDPNSATGLALDNIVAYGGISRFGESFSTAVAVFSGDNGTLIPSGNTVRASISGNQFTTVGSVALKPSAASSISVTVGTPTSICFYSRNNSYNQ